MKNPFRRESKVDQLRAVLAEYKSYDQLPEGLWQEYVSAMDWGQTINLESAVGLPAILAVLRFLSHSVAMIPFEVLRDTEPSSNLRERALDTWQWRLLNRRPAPPPVTPFNLKADIALNFSGRGQAFVRKIKPANPVTRFSGQTPRVTELMNLHAGNVKPQRADTGQVEFIDSTGPKPVTRQTDEIIQIRSMSVDKDGLSGVSPITAARTFVSAGLKRHQFEDRHLTNGIYPGMAINLPRGMQEEQAGRWLDMIEQRHKGSAKAGKVIGVPDGATITPLPLSLQDALFADMTRLTIEQACALYQIPMAIFVANNRRPVTDDDFRHFAAFAVGPIARAMVEAFEADDDLFAPGEETLRVVPKPDALLDMDPLKKAQVQGEQIQRGIKLVDEVRGENGDAPLPPIPDDWSQHPGQIPQITPVGGAPNPEVDTGADAPIGGNIDG